VVSRSSQQGGDHSDGLERIRLPRYGHPRDRVSGRVLTAVEHRTLRRVLANFGAVMRSGHAFVECVGFGPTGSVIKIDVRVWLINLYGRAATVGRNKTLCLSIALDRLVRTLYYQSRAVRDYRNCTHVTAVEPDSNLGQRLLQRKM